MCHVVDRGIASLLWARMAGRLNGGNHWYSQRVVPLDSIAGDVALSLQGANQVFGRGPLRVGNAIGLRGGDEINTDHRLVVEPPLLLPMLGRGTMSLAVDDEVSLASLLAAHRPLRSDADTAPGFGD